MKKQVFFCTVIIVLLNITAMSAQVNWLTSQQAAEKAQKEPKKFLFYFYSPWSAWDKIMEKTFADPAVVAYVNEKFYPVKINTDEKIINFFGKEYGDTTVARKVETLNGWEEKSLTLNKYLFLVFGFNYATPAIYYADEAGVRIKKTKGWFPSRIRYSELHSRDETYHSSEAFYKEGYLAIFEGVQQPEPFLLQLKYIGENFYQLKSWKDYTPPDNDQ